MPDEPQSYSEKYRGTQWGQQAPAPAPPTPTGRRRPRAFAIFLLISALVWLVPRVIGLGADVALGLNHSLLGSSLPQELEASLGTIILGSALVQIIWILVGLKLLLSPGGRTLGCTGLLWLLAATALAVAIVNNPNQTSTGFLFLAVMIAFSGVMGVASVLVAQW